MASMTASPSGWHRRRDTPTSRARQRVYASAEYQRLKRLYQREVDAGRAYCWRCGRHLPRGCKWHLGHNDAWTQVMGAECPTCNLRAAARKGAAIVNARAAARGRRTGALRWRSRPWV